MHYDVIVLGGGYAGMAAALQVARARRSVLVIDVGLRRNRFASHSHGFLGQDGSEPGEIARHARAQLMAYPTVTWFEDTAITARHEADGFAITLKEGQPMVGRRLIMALGVKDRHALSAPILGAGRWLRLPWSRARDLAGAAWRRALGGAALFPRLG